jgi:TrmH family RNA methyltransferase
MPDSVMLTVARDLKRRKARERRTLFVAEGVRTVDELLRSSIPVRGVLTTAAFAASERGSAILAAFARRGTSCTEVSEKDFLSAADTEHPQGVLAIAEMPAHSLASLALGPTVRMLVLDAVQDPGNVGTLVRTGAALGSSAVVALSGTADVWNAKAVRGAAGAQFVIPTIQSSVDELVPFLQARTIALWGTAADGAPVDSVKPPARLALAFGNEGAGLSAAVRAATERMVALPMSSGIESLNVAVAAGIALYALRP